MTERATLEELKEFANAVREAGGGNPIDALMPAVPEDSSQCLIARNLNFNCVVEPAYRLGLGDKWIMAVDSREVRNKIAEKLRLRRLNLISNSSWEEVPRYAVVLPNPIAQVARDFDKVGEAVYALSWYLDNEPDLLEELEAYAPEMLALIRELAPFIEAAQQEARKLASIINPDGSIVR